MATDIQLKRSYTSGSVPGAANVLVGEPVLNLADRLLYTKDSTGNVIVISSGFAGNIASLAFEAANVAASYTVAGVAGNVSNIQLASGITSSGLLSTANISELTNLYFTNARARASISVASGNVNGKGSYDPSTGVISINAANVTVSSSAPTNPYVGDIWINAETANEYLFFGDGDTYQWVETGVSVASTDGSSYGDSNVALLGYATNANVALKANVADLRTANVVELTNLYFTNARATTAVTNTSLSNLTIGGNVIVTYQPATVTGYGITITAANTVGGTGYADVIKLTNSSGGSTNPNKTFRINQTGGLEVINSAYLVNILTLEDTGNVQINGSLTMPNRPAFRVVGSGGQIASTANVTSSNWTVDYQQGTALNGTTGFFTAPIAGLYQVNLTTRTSVNNYNGIIQSVVQQNYSGGNKVVIMIEYGNNTSMNHTGGSTIVKMAVGDSLQFRVLAGTISFDGNDNWSVAYLG